MEGQGNNSLLITNLRQLNNQIQKNNKEKSTEHHDNKYFFGNFM